MSFLSIYHEELEANFQYYSQSMQKGVYKNEINSQIVLQGYFHFLKIANLAKSTHEAVDLHKTVCQIEGVAQQIEDTLNKKNGLNYAQFLEAILRIAFVKAAENQKSYASTLEDIFSNPALDIKKRCQTDNFLSSVYEDEENTRIFRDHEHLLIAIFERRGLIKDNTYTELAKQQLLVVLKEAGIIKAPEKKAVASKDDAGGKDRKGAAKGGAKGGAGAKGGD